MTDSVARLDQTPKTVSIVDLSLDGRGVARWPEGHANAGKAVFVSGALPGETVSVQQTARSRHFDEAKTLEVIEASPDRVEPRCPHFGTCGGCVLQHFAEERQIESKQRVLLENLQRIGHVSPQSVLPPLRGDSWGYRRKGRFSVRRVEKKDKTLVGFREQDPRFVADIGECHVVVPQLGFKVAALGALVDGLDARRDIPQIEFIAGDAQIALVFRHLQPLSDADKAKLAAFAEAEGFSIFLQPGGIDSVHPLTGDAPQLSFRLPQWDIELMFRPLDFIQVNAKLNEAMIARALELLDVQPGERVLDLFCGLGNFTLPLARAAGDGEVVGVEGDAGLVQRARANAAHNGLGNATFHAADLVQDLAAQPWLKAGFDKLLLDPARSGAIEVLKQLPLKGLKRIVYVSCHPGSLARDAGFLVNDAGWTLREAGVMDMFPHTAHVESIAVFDPPKKR
ncbi:23S rRNA (uracil(1939)-C(5))-methyltransferase RlmD [Thermomonas sp.]|uniref:23S rRNA (uracil(1939)-C(5))-methyltransferase RlmD n=1 Tax=Thermomonas sp. TaxID=1971895 RepID=UPI001B4AF755|nr:23S rRNA (uracil(1939)-C(5))-methyltransferase RlmD [Thermomonas sp.]MBK9670119.1 23S rRNA (uracil(1939)-C(5))-methyltransferase RlmD [Thermomonas sp.]MBL0229154.1 23S rRNA (uracil(1939)-C(5))-methyltransferase RlmD [Thermomonas sp.]MBP6438365.1 23S rRNA (uracil(1939)-C(5))-methyltransferase RlmD [Thermomonas sp.]MBP7788134.1 23S rRNA (uracil(1939)-C(5))-methyltransferase RlmD [Thermomonas sp.]